MVTSPKGMTLIEVLVTLAVMAVLSLMSFMALERLALGKSALLQTAQEQRRLILIQAQLERDLLPLNRMQPNERVNAVSLAERRLRLPLAEWRWDETGLYRKGLEPGEAQETRYWSGSLVFEAAYLAVGGDPLQRAPVSPGVANPRALELTLESAGRRLTRLYYIGPLE